MGETYERLRERERKIRERERERPDLEREGGKCVAISLAKLFTKLNTLYLHACAGGFVHKNSIKSSLTLTLTIALDFLGFTSLKIEDRMGGNRCHSTLLIADTTWCDQATPLIMQKVAVGFSRAKETEKELKKEVPTLQKTLRKAERDNAYHAQL